MDEFLPPHFIKYDIYLYINIYTYTSLRIFMYLCAKSIPKANKLVSLENGYKQMITVLNKLAVLYSILIGRKKYSCQNFDQAKALLESGQKLVTRT